MPNGFLESLGHDTAKPQRASATANAPWIPQVVKALWVRHLALNDLAQWSMNDSSFQCHGKKTCRGGGRVD
eukprot:snap_masked-scaffold_14-processed-gene-11.48-mRNA-1 protein AED:1.00 eAED:1.00 QI:0/-1/0/0/-1/1/1/0/70